MKNKKTAIIIAFLLGGLGIHHFYLRNYFKGILSLVFCFTWIPLLIGLYDAIVLLRMSNDNFNLKYNLDAINAEKERIRLSNENRQRLINLYGEEAAENILNGKIWQGMTKDMLMESVGSPSSSKETVTKTAKKEKYYYGRYYTDRGTEKFKVEVQLENNILVGWKDL